LSVIEISTLSQVFFLALVMRLFFVLALFSLAVANLLKSFSLEMTSKCTGSETHAFDKIYAKGEWGPPLVSDPRYYYTYGFVQNLTRVSSSGWGSNVGPATQASLAFLSSVINEFRVTSMIDVPCGDMNWQTQSWELDSIEHFAGLDITKSVIELNQLKFRFHSNKRFAVHDLACPLPRFRRLHATMSEPFELVHVRDVIQHMPLSKGVAAIANVRASGARLLVATTFPASSNVDIQEGGFYHNNLDAAPFTLPKPVKCVETHRELEPDLTCLYVLK
jgi:hypothetical protein